MAADKIQTVQRPGLPQVPSQQPQQVETAATVLAAQAEALIKARFAVAQYHPRNMDLVRQKLLRECERPSFAAVAIYRKPIGEGIEGPSIRFAEAALANMGNLVIETPAIYDDNEKRIVRVSVADMETNVVHSKDVTIQKRVERSSIREGQVPLKTRTNSKGRTVYIVEATDDEMLNTENALVSKALRTTGLRLVPGGLVDECMEACDRTRELADRAVDPDTAKRKLFDSFVSVGVTAEQVTEWLGRSPDTLTPAERKQLGGIYVAIKDGETTWKEVMDAKWAATLDALGANAAAAAKSRTEEIKEKLSGKPASTPPPEPGSEG